MSIVYILYNTLSYISILFRYYIICISLENIPTCRIIKISDMSLTFFTLLTRKNYDIVVNKFYTYDGKYKLKSNIKYTDIVVY